MALFTLLLELLPLVSLACAYGSLSDATLRGLPGPGLDFDIRTGALLAPILRPRVSGTDGSRAVLQHFVDFFKKELPEWRLELHNSSSPTPTSNGQPVPFVNLIATRDPPGAAIGDVGRLTLAAHYDSKLEPEGFVGAIDSAAPCAMLMHAARSVDKALTGKWAAMAADGSDELEDRKGLQILLLDGEEAFKVWTRTDSLYGSRYACMLPHLPPSHSGLLTVHVEPSPKSGSDPSILPHQPTRRHSTPSTSSFCSTCSVPEPRPCLPSTKQPTGLTSTWQLPSAAYGTWVYSSRHRIIRSA